MRILHACCLSLLVMSAPGCGPKVRLAPVQGLVTYRDQPLPSGSVMFVPERGPTATGEIRDGRFELSTEGLGKGAIPGTYEVAVVSVENTAGRLPEDRGPPPVEVPMKYMTARTSGLTAEVEDGPNAFTFDLK